MMDAILDSLPTIIFLFFDVLNTMTNIQRDNEEAMKTLNDQNSDPRDDDSSEKNNGSKRD